ncbi:MAG: tetratricopeptide repeat protein, partial [Acidobacteriota bacterium]
WTSIVTGKTPDKHGILDFFAEDPATGKNVPVTSNLRRCKALWNILSDLEMDVSVTDWLASWPAETVQGTLVSDRLAYHSFDPSPEHYEAGRKTYPDLLFGTLEPLIVQDRDVSYGEVRRFLDIDRSRFEAHSGGRYDPSDPIQNFRLIYATTETYRKVALHLAERPARFFGVYFELLDAVCHLFIKHMKPAMADVPAEEVASYGRAVEETYRYQDEIIGDLLGFWDRTNTTVIVLSDHGFRSGPLRLQSSSRIHGPGGAAAEWHRLHGFLALCGPHTLSGVELPRASVLDITPTVLYLLGLPVASDMDGRVLLEAFDSTYTAEHPVLRIQSYESGEERVPEAPITSPDDEALRERLAALGYVDKDGPNVHNNLAQSYLERGEYEKALAEYRRAIELEPKSARLWSNLGMAYLRMESYEEAVEPLKHALELKPDFEAALSNLGVAYTYLGRLEDAAEVIERAVRLEPGRAEYHDNLGVIYSRMGRKTRALECFRAAAALEPQFPEPYNNLGAVAMEVGNLEEARESFRRALAVAPDFFDTRFNLGLLEIRAGNFSEAVKQLEAAVRIRPRHPEAHYQLGLAYRETGDMEKARREWRTTVTVDPDGPTGAEAAAELEK